MYKLYSFYGSGNSYKVGLLLALLGLDAEKVEVDLLSGEQDAPEFLQLNPVGEVPVLVDGDVVLRDSGAILVYLAGRHAAESWWSQDPREQAEIVGWLAFAASWVQYGLTIARAIVVFGGAYSGVGKVAHANSLKEAQIRGTKALAILERTLADRDWLALGRSTIADVAVFPYVALAPMGGLSLEPFPFVRRWIDRIHRLPNFYPIAGLDGPGRRGPEVG